MTRKNMFGYGTIAMILGIMCAAWSGAQLLALLTEVWVPEICAGLMLVGVGVWLFVIGHDLITT